MAVEYPIESCDVENQKALAEFRKRRDQWIYWLDGDEHHSLSHQISGMLWNDATFRAINESRRVAAGLDGTYLATNGLLGEFIDAGWVAAQALAIRRLVEKEGRHPERQPISLPRLLADIRRNRLLITRENFVCFDGLPYDYEPVKQNALEELREHQRRGKGPMWGHTKGPKAWSTSERCHEQFDRLSGVDAGNRSRSDTISEVVFDQVSGVLAIKEIEQVINFGDKFVAHAADGISRSTLSDGDKNLTMDRVSACHVAIIRYAKMIGGDLLWDADRSFMPIAQFDPFAGFDVPWLPKDALDALQDFWDDYVRATEKIRAPEIQG